MAAELPPSILLARYWQQTPDSIPHIDDVEMLSLGASTTLPSRAPQEEDLVEEVTPLPGLSFSISASPEICVLKSGRWEIK